MSDTMGTFRIDIEVENPARPGPRRALSSVLVDTGAELTWCPATVLESLGVERRKLVRFRQADGSVLEGLNLRVDPVSKRLVDAGPVPAAVAQV